MQSPVHWLDSRIHVPLAQKYVHVPQAGPELPDDPDDPLDPLDELLPLLLDDDDPLDVGSYMQQARRISFSNPPSVGSGGQIQPVSQDD